AMIAFSKGETKQLLRAILPLGEGRLFGSMPGGMGGRSVFGAKLISVFPENFAKGVQSHQGVVVLFDGESGAPVCVLHAGEITAIRTGAASAVATDVLARKDARRLAVLGYGEQAHTHARAISKVRKLDAITVWGRSTERAQHYAREVEGELGVPVTPAPTSHACVVDADIVCTVSAAKEPILEGKWLRPGTHVNIVGSSYTGPVEVDNDLVARARFIADSRKGVLAQGAEFLRAKEAGIIGDDHIAGEIGQVLGGDIEGRQNDAQITAYKSLGHIVQDLAAAWALYSRD
ncbi:MAG TPA: ornithine cyclodeaminase family protein, partial [Vitreimonas sp.]|nr:ornithine cyclodeaminase family protein [Vitreimonas sp.]